MIKLTEFEKYVRKLGHNLYLRRKKDEHGFDSADIDFIDNQYIWFNYPIDRIKYIIENTILGRGEAQHYTGEGCILFHVNLSPSYKLTLVIAKDDDTKKEFFIIELGKNTKYDDYCRQDSLHYSFLNTFEDMLFEYEILMQTMRMKMIDKRLEEYDDIVESTFSSYYGSEKFYRNVMSHNYKNMEEKSDMQEDFESPNIIKFPIKRVKPNL